MSNEGGNGVPRASSLPSKRVLNDEDQGHPSKRPRVEERLLGSRELAPRPPNLEIQNTPTPPAATKSTATKRSLTLNLKNYPSNHHPVGIAVWILQKVEQARRELDAQRSASYNNDTPANKSPVRPLADSAVSGLADSDQWPGASLSSYMNAPSSFEQEAERLQAQRNRKTKQRQENWAKNKETDCVARAKIEAKKHFEAYPYATDADQQRWIEEKVRMDFGRLLDRMAAQMNSEIVGIPAYQIGFADYHFNRTSNPQLSQFDDETITAARLIAYVLPALTESVVSPRHQYDADMLIHALVQNTPHSDAFIAAVYMLAQNYQVLAGLDKLMGNLFLPKTGPQLARKRANNVYDQPSSFGASPNSSTAHGGPVWHWKEPATIANSGRYVSPSVKALTANGEAPAGIVQPYHQDTLPPPQRVQAQFFRPPPAPPGYYQYPLYMQNHQDPLHMQSQPQTHPQPYNLAPTFAPAFLENDSRHVNHDTRAPMGDRMAILPDAPARSSLNEDSYAKMPSLSHSTNDTPGCTVEVDISRLSPRSPLQDQPMSDAPAMERRESELPATVHQATVSSRSMSPPKTSRHRQTSNKSSEERIEPSIIPEGFAESVPALGAGPRRRSSRGTILTSKAKAAGILLGTQNPIPDEASSSELRRAPRTRQAIALSTSPDAYEEQSQEVGTIAAKTTNGIELTQSEPLEISDAASKDSYEHVTPIEGFVPRSSGRERKPTAKVLASSTLRSGLKSSEPRVSSKLRLSLSSASSEDSVIQHGDTKKLLPIDSTDVPQNGDRATSQRRHEDTPVDSKFVGLRPPNMEHIESTERHAHRHDRLPKLKKSSKFLTNDHGQSMSQALLMVAHIAAEWSDSEDSSDEDEAKEQVFQTKLRHAVNKHLGQSQSLAKTQNGMGTSSQDSPVTLLPAKSDSNAAPASSHYEPALPQTQPDLEPWSFPKRASFSNHSTTAPTLRNLAPTYNQPVLQPATVHTFNGDSSSHPNDGLASHPHHGSGRLGTYSRSNSRIADDWLSILALKDEARSRGLPISDSMGLDQLRNLLRAHDVGELSVVSKPSLRTLAPSPARSAAMPLDPPSRNGSANSSTDENHFGQFSRMPFSQFHSSVWQSEPRYHSTSPALTTVSAVQSTYAKPIQYTAPALGDTEQHTAAFTRKSERPESIERMISSSRGSSRSRTPSGQFASRHESNSGLNGGPPGGGTVIMKPKARVVQAKPKQNSKDPNPESVNANGGERATSTPSTRDGGSATPQPQPQGPQISSFKRGGTLVSFSKNAPRATAA